MKTREKRQESKRNLSSSAATSVKNPIHPLPFSVGFSLTTRFFCSHFTPFLKSLITIRSFQSLSIFLCSVMPLSTIDTTCTHGPSNRNHHSIICYFILPLLLYRLPPSRSAHSLARPSLFPPSHFPVLSPLALPSHPIHNRMITILIILDRTSPSLFSVERCSSPLPL